MVKIELVKTKTDSYECGHEIHFTNENNDRMVFGGAIGYDHSYVTFHPKNFNIQSCNLKFLISKNDTEHFGAFREMFEGFMNSGDTGYYSDSYKMENNVITCLSTNESQRQHSCLLITMENKDAISFNYLRKQPEHTTFQGNTIELATRKPTEHPLCRCQYRLLNSLKLHSQNAAAKQNER